MIRSRFSFVALAVLFAVSAVQAQATATVKCTDGTSSKGGKGDGKPTATCKDGTQSFAKNHSGACSKHGGVKEWLDGTAKKP
jgi:hypothetical protein